MPDRRAGDAGDCAARLKLPAGAGAGAPQPLEAIAEAESVDFEDALFLDAQRGWVGGNVGIWQWR